MHSDEGNTSGPAIRAYNIAKSLAKKGNEVTLAEKGREATEIVGTLKLVPWKDSILDEIKQFDAAYIQIWSNDSAFLKKVSLIPLMVDVYAPFMIEHIYHDYSKKTTDIKKFRDTILLPSLNPFLYGDIFLCSNDRQRKYFLGLLTSVGRISPFSRKQDLIRIVPFGIREESPIFEKDILRKKKELKDKKIILWMGPLFPWYDPFSLIEAMGIVAKKHPDYALVFIGSSSPKVQKHLTNSMHKKALKLSSELKLLDKNIFFYEWMDYASLVNVYFEAEFSVATHPKTLEMEIASEKGRALDSLWANLPVICSSGDYLSELVSSRELGLTVKIGDKKDIASKIETLIENPDMLKKFRENAKIFAKERRWDELVLPIDEFCSSPAKDENKHIYNIYRMLAGIREESEINKFEMALLNEKAHKKESEIRLLREISSSQLGMIGKFKGSIIYPLYRLTSTIGDTPFGRILQKILK